MILWKELEHYRKYLKVELLSINLDGPLAKGNFIDVHSWKSGYKEGPITNSLIKVGLEELDTDQKYYDLINNHEEIKNIFIIKKGSKYSRELFFTGDKVIKMIEMDTTE